MRDNQTQKNHLALRYVAWGGYLVGLLAGLTLAVMLVWAGVEASQFDPGMTREAVLTGLRCPAVLSATEAGQVQVTLENGEERPLNFLVRTHISDGFVSLIRQERTMIKLSPGERQELVWPVEASDAAFERLILVRVHVLPAFPYPYRQGTCGILVLNTPLPGSLVLGLTLAVSLVGMGGGLWWFWRRERPLTGRLRTAVLIASGLAALVMVMVIAALLRLWVIGLLLMAFLLLLIAALLERYGRA